MSKALTTQRYGVIGKVERPDRTIEVSACVPDRKTDITDPAGLHFVHGVTKGAGGASGESMSCCRSRSFHPRFRR